MLKREQILNQSEAAEYINEHGIRMTGPELSSITNSGGGPLYTKKGNQKLFLIPDVDAWIKEEKKRRKTV